jgi:hypothetical protein
VKNLERQKRIGDLKQISKSSKWSVMWKLSSTPPSLLQVATFTQITGDEKHAHLISETRTWHPHWNALHNGRVPLDRALEGRRTVHECAMVHIVVRKRVIRGYAHMEDWISHGVL